jgi:hypothetical protein
MVQQQTYAERLFRFGRLFWIDCVVLSIFGFGPR